MLFLSAVYIAMVLVIFWSYCGYLVFLYLYAIFSNDELVSCATLRPGKAIMHVVVACYNESGMILGKVKNLEELSFPADRLQVTFVDGQSTDGTRELLQAAIADKPGWSLRVSPVKGKNNQLNHFLEATPEAEYVMCTDADAILLPDTAAKLFNILLEDEDIAVVGAHISPKNALEVDEHFWSDQNNVRQFESRVHSSSIVVAPCYLFRTSVVRRFPDDCVADDVYAAFKANSEGYRVLQIQDAFGFELRNPATLDEYFRHKFRKVNAFVIELLRFSYRFPTFPGLFKVIYASKICQILIAPWLVFFFIPATISLLLSGGSLREMAAMSVGFLFISMLLSSLIMKAGRSSFVTAQGRTNKKRMIFITFFLNNFIMLWAGACFPFYRQSSTYRKCNSAARPTKAENTEISAVCAEK